MCAAGPSPPVDSPDDHDEQLAVPTLLEPVGGIPDLCSTPDSLALTAHQFADGAGPVALDAERASGHRYGQRAFLVQANRRGSGIALIDPEALPDLSPFGAAIAEAEWVLHSATQDLACLAEVGLAPQRLFDTELAARLLNLPRVGLASLTESLLGWHLAKGHSAADWSIRPLPRDYLRYAALDVELLIDLRDVLEERLASAGKLEWARQEFEALVTWEQHSHPEPWRRTSGSSQLRTVRQLGALRALWLARDALAADLDRAPTRVLPDSALTAAAEAMPERRADILSLPGFKRQHRRLDLWWQAIASARALPAEALPTLRAPLEGPPQPRTWGAKFPDAAERFGRARAAVLRVADSHDLPPEVLISPDAIRRLAWRPPTPLDAESVAEFLIGRGVRPWQVGLLAEELAAAIVEVNVT